MDKIGQCRYYKGEKKCPFPNSALKQYWEWERIYVLSDFVGEREVYENIKGKKFSGIPYDLLIIMFTGWAKYAYDLEKEISQFYDVVDDYLSIPSDYIPKDKIPG